MVRAREAVTAHTKLTRKSGGRHADRPNTMRTRWWVAFAGIMVMLGPGAVYSYSLFTQPLLASFNWTTTQTTWAFALANFFLGLGGVIGGIMAYRGGTRSVALIGVTLWGLATSWRVMGPPASAHSGYG